MQKLAKIDDKAFKTACAEGESVVKQSEQYIKTLKFEKSKQIKEVIAADFATVPGSKFQCIRGIATVKTTVEACLKYDHDYEDFGPEAPKEKRHGKSCRWTYYLNDEQKQQHDALKKGELTNNAQYLCY